MPRPPVISKVATPKPPRTSKVPVGDKQELKDAVLIDAVESKEPWSEYELSDGSGIKMKSMLVEIWRVKDEYDSEGNPQYVVKANTILNITPADELKKKA